VGTVMIGVEQFFEIWTHLATELIVSYDPPPDFEMSMKGKMKDILSAETALEFVTWAHRARMPQMSGVFRRADYVRDALRAELKPYEKARAKLKPDEKARIGVSPDAHRRGTNRLNNSVNETMETFIHYGLFQKTVVKHEYALSRKGNEFYDTLDQADLTPASRDRSKCAA
jgi:hypothetical protein